MRCIQAWSTGVGYDGKAVSRDMQGHMPTAVCEHAGCDTLITFFVSERGTGCLQFFLTAFAGGVTLVCESYAYVMAKYIMGGRFGDFWAGLFHTAYFGCRVHT